MCDFAPGDVVVCVDDAPCRRFGHACPLTKGTVYTVDRVEPTDDVPGVIVRELPEATQFVDAWEDGEPFQVVGWNPRRFRRVYRPDGSLTAGLLEGRFTKEPA